MQMHTKDEFSLLLKDALNSLYRVSLRLTGNHIKAEDLVSETCIKAWKKFSSLKNQQSFKPWIYKICHNLFISMYRKQKKETAIMYEYELLKKDEDFSLFEQLSSPLFLSDSNPEKEFLNKISAGEINSALDSLPAIYKSVVTLCCLEDIHYQQAAKILNLPIGTVRSRLHRGKAILQKLLWETAREKGII